MRLIIEIGDATVYAGGCYFAHRSSGDCNGGTKNGDCSSI